MSSSRRVRRLTVRAPDRGSVSAAASRLEDAVRTASLPGLPAHGVVYLRRLELGSLAEDTAAGDLSRAIDDVVGRVRIAAAGPGRSPDARAAAVWFASDLEPYRALAELIGQGHRPKAWYWPVAVPGWSGSLPSAQAAVRLLDGASRMSTGLAGVAYVAEPLLPGLLLEALEVAGPEATSRWEARCGVLEPLVRAPEVTLGARLDAGDVRGPRAGTVGGMAVRVGRAGLAAAGDDRAGRAGRGGTREDGARPLPADRPDPDGGGPRAASAAATRPPSAAWRSALGSVVARRGVADPRASFLASLALSSVRRGVTRADAAELLREVAGEGRHGRSKARRGGVERGDAGASQPVEAVPGTVDREPGWAGGGGGPLDHAGRGVSPPRGRSDDGAPTASREDLPGARHSPPHVPPAPDDTSADRAVVRPPPGRGPTEPAAPGPRSAPPADGSAERDRAARRSTAPDGGRSEHGGLAFLVVALQRLGFQDFIGTFPEYVESDLGLHVLERAATLLRTPPDDPARALLTDTRPTGRQPTAFVAPPAWRAIVAGVRADRREVRLQRELGSPGTRLVADVTGRLVLARWRGDDPTHVGSWLENATVVGIPSRARAWTYPAVVDNWVMAMATYGRRFAGAKLRHLVARPALVAATRTHLDVVFTMNDLDSSIRAAGLDIDPGWVPWLGRVVRFHYVEGGGSS